MSDKKLLPADLDPRNPSYVFKNKYNEYNYKNPFLHLIAIHF